MLKSVHLYLDHSKIQEYKFVLLTSIKNKIQYPANPCHSTVDYLYKQVILKQW